MGFNSGFKELNESNQNRSVPLHAFYWNCRGLLSLITCINLEGNCFIVERCGSGSVSGWRFNSSFCNCMSLLPSDGTAGNLFATKLDTKQCTTILANVWEYLLCWKTRQATVIHPWYFRTRLCTRNKECVHLFLMSNDCKKNLLN